MSRKDLWATSCVAGILPLNYARNDPTRVHVALLASRRTATAIELAEVFDAPGDEFVGDGENVFLYYPGGCGRTKLSHTYSERKCKMPVSVRNWKTVIAPHSIVAV